MYNIMRFLKFEQPTDPFEKMLKKLQEYYIDIIAWVDKASKSSMYSYFNTECELDDFNVTHKFSRCFVTRQFIKMLLTKSIREDKIENIDSLYTMTPSDILIEEYELNGPSFPDHLFLIIKYKNKFYLLQSYYFAYRISGKYGLIALDETEYQELKDIIEGYKYKGYQNIKVCRTLLSSSLNSLTEDEQTLCNDILKLNNRLSNFTGIDSSKHFRDVSIMYKNTDSNEVIDSVFIMTLDNFILNFSNNLTNIFISMSNKDANTLKISNIEIYNEYLYYDSFINNDTIINNDIIDINKFNSLVGYDFKQIDDNLLSLDDYLFLITNDVNSNNCLGIQKIISGNKNYDTIFINILNSINVTRILREIYELIYSSVKILNVKLKTVNPEDIFNDINKQVDDIFKAKRAILTKDQESDFLQIVEKEYKKAIDEARLNNLPQPEYEKIANEVEQKIIERTRGILFGNKTISNTPEEDKYIDSIILEGRYPSDWSREQIIAASAPPPESLSLAMYKLKYIKYKTKYQNLKKLSSL